MGHLVDQVEVAALESQINKSTVTTITTATTSTTAVDSDASAATCSTITTTTATTDTRPPQGSIQSPSILHPSQQRPVPVAQNESKPKQRKLQFKLDDEGSPDKKPKEKLEEENLEEEESGWWAERVAIALGGMPEYRDAWYKSHAHLLHGDGPLPHTWRLYVAALAVCRHEVSWLMQALLADFRNAGGDMRWTVSIHHAPPKLYALTSINNILAHRPWLLTSEHIKQLTKGEGSWSLGELCQALCIMTHFHALASLLHGCKLSSIHSPSKKEDGQGNAMKSGSSCKGRTGGHDSGPQNNNSPSESGKSSSTSESAGRSYKHLTINPTYSYEDVVCEDDTRVPSFFVQEYNWQDHGYAMCSRLVGDVGVYFDDRFTSAVRLDFPPCKDQAPKTSSIDQLNNALCDKTPGKVSPLSAKELWSYVQWLLGIHHDDCDYVDLNKRLQPQIRDFVKTACCFPETLSDVNSNPTTTSCVQTSIVETSVIVMEARLQSELLYALRAIMLHHC